MLLYPMILYKKKNIVLASQTVTFENVSCSLKYKKDS